MTDDRELKTQWGKWVKTPLFVLVIGHPASVIPASLVEKETALALRGGGLSREPNGYMIEETLPRSEARLAALQAWTNETQSQVNAQAGVQAETQNAMRVAGIGVARPGSQGPQQTATGQQPAEHGAHVQTDTNLTKPKGPENVR